MWDLVYPRGTWVIYNPQDYSDKKYLNGELYYPDPNGTYIENKLKD